ncbi:DUF2971 domain-containing protein [Paraburkholderia azotifigens]|uniref:DUF2971 domain-containing protein n=1 Tax=Paraburkholderia azotifigens TaxID=2057004 RepID=A0A5C6V6B2_9BURK|nr:DUF2971 domain-containing protein [Paraburkholderia azotifigens]TXC80772.1 DUF2971 domain-containing protein [Paraburkholderia azotifigens]
MNVLSTDTTPVVYVEPGQLDIQKEVFFTKTSKWSYEREWRTLKYLTQADEVPPVEGNEAIHLFLVPMAAVKEVIFGSEEETNSGGG